MERRGGVEEAVRRGLAMASSWTMASSGAGRRVTVVGAQRGRSRSSSGRGGAGAMRGESGRQAPAKGWPEAPGGGSVAKGSGPSAPIQAGKGERGVQGASGGVGIGREWVDRLGFRAPRGVSRGRGWAGLAAW